MNPNQMHEEEHPSLFIDAMVTHMNVLEDTLPWFMQEIHTLTPVRMSNDNVVVEVHGLGPSELEMA